MHERDRNRSLAHTRCHTLHRTVPDITHDKDSGNVRFQKSWVAIELPTVWAFAITCELRAGIDKATFIALHDVCEPVCVWRCSNHNEKRIRRNFVDLVRLGTVNRNRLEVIFAMRLHDGRVVFDLNVWSGLELIDQILRHRSRKRRAAYEY